MRALLLFFALAAGTGLAAPPPFELIADYLDRDLPAAEVPEAPVRRALESLAELHAGAKLLVPLRAGATSSGSRYALAAWRSDAKATSFDAILVLDMATGARIIEATSTAKDVEVVLAALLAHATREPVMAAAAPPALAPERVEYFGPPTEWATRFVVLLARNPSYRPGDTTAELALTERHIQYTLKLQHEGTALVAGPFGAGVAATPAAADGPIGMTLLRVRDLAAAERIAAQDPAVAAGRLIATVREWTVPAGRLP